MINDRLEILILNNLFHNDEYSRKVMPFIKAEYFSDDAEKIIFEKISNFVNEFHNIPTKEAILIACSNDTKIPNGLDSKISELISSLKGGAKPDSSWLIQETEKFCQDKAIYNGVLESVQILQDRTGKKSKGSIPKLLQDALSVSFDPNVGHNYTEDAEQRYEFYHRVEEKIPFDLKYLNKITKGGVPRKSLNIILAGTAVGKSLAMCHMAGACLLQGKNVLYITLEMAEERIAERIDANLLNIRLDTLQDLSKETYFKKVSEIKKKTTGKLIIKEYPTATATVNHFRALLQELYLKRGFTPDIIFVDYLNIAASARISHGNHTTNTYVYIKSIAEEFRGLAVEYNLPIWSATQTNRSGYTSTDLGLEDTSESFGLPATADFMIALMSTEELEKMGQLLVKQLKNRYHDVNTHRAFVVGVDRAKMRLFDVDDSAQQGLTGGTPLEKDEDASVFDKTSFGNGMRAEKKSFDDFKF